MESRRRERERYPDLPSGAEDVTLAQGRLVEAVARLGQALAVRAPLVLFLDDVQWADLATRDLLHYVVRRCTATASCGRGRADGRYAAGRNRALECRGSAGAHELCAVSAFPVR